MRKPFVPFLLTLFTLPYKKADKISKFTKELYSNDKFHQFAFASESLTCSKQFVNEICGSPK